MADVNFYRQYRHTKDDLGFFTCGFFFKDAEHLGTRHHIHFFSTSTEHIDLN